MLDDLQQKVDALAENLVELTKDLPFVDQHHTMKLFVRALNAGVHSPAFDNWVRANADEVVARYKAALKD
jgi:tagatose-1,6-bisphosphate aldolase non-catalytic subunit AgaZ/GatZ